MKQGIHPDYQIANVHCSCGNTFTTRSTVSEIRAEICSNCHPFYTGKQKLLDAGGRVERFQRRYAKNKPQGEAERLGARSGARPSQGAPLRRPSGGRGRDDAWRRRLGRGGARAGGESTSSPTTSIRLPSASPS